jgi:hypothetical protein
MLLCRRTDDRCSLIVGRWPIERIRKWFLFNRFTIPGSGLMGVRYEILFSSNYFYWIIARSFQLDKLTVNMTGWHKFLPSDLFQAADI